MKYFAVHATKPSIRSNLPIFIHSIKNAMLLENATAIYRHATDVKFPLSNLLSIYPAYPTHLLSLSVPNISHFSLTTHSDKYNCMKLYCHHWNRKKKTAHWKDFNASTTACKNPEKHTLHGKKAKIKKVLLKTRDLNHWDLRKNY